jgi:hypothetical protein
MYLVYETFGRVAMQVLREPTAGYPKSDRFEEVSQAMQKANEIRFRRCFPASRVSNSQE